MEIPELKKFQSHQKIHVFHMGLMEIKLTTYTTYTGKIYFMK